jgi:hypothetical protein
MQFRHEPALRAQPARTVREISSELPGVPVLDVLAEERPPTASRFGLSAASAAGAAEAAYGQDVPDV